MSLKRDGHCKFKELRQALMSCLIFCSILVTVLLIKRLIANMDPIQGTNKFKTLFYRLIFDRDVRSKCDWMREY